MRSSICLTFIGFRKCTKIHINIDSLRVHRSVRPGLCRLYSHNCLHILSKVSRSTARQPTQGVGSIRCGSSKILNKSPNFNFITNIKSFDFSTLYTTIPHQKLKSRLATIIRNSFIHKNWKSEIQILRPYFVREHSDSKSKYTEEDIIRMLGFLVGNIFVVFAGKVFQQIIGIPLGTNCPPLLADICLYSYEAEFISPCSRPVGNGWHLSSTSQMTCCPLITLTLKIVSVRCIPLNLRSKKRRRATRLLPTWIYSCQSLGTVNFTLPFTTSVSILISIL